MDIAENYYDTTFANDLAQYGQAQATSLTDPFSWDITTRNLVALASQGVVYFLLALYIEARSHTKTSVKTQSRMRRWLCWWRSLAPKISSLLRTDVQLQGEDSDVADERETACAMHVDGSLEPCEVVTRGLGGEFSASRSGAVSNVNASPRKALADKDSVVIVKNLSKIYNLHSKKHRKIAVNRVSMHVRQGECMGLLGVNGAGKV
jgi:ABC-type glutathione transport system ATPase component